MGDAKIMERTGEMGEPCGVPTCRLYGSEVKLLNFRDTWWSVRKDSNQDTCHRQVAASLTLFVSFDISE
jgi:hypothetical protein